MSRKIVFTSIVFSNASLDFRLAFFIGMEMTMANETLDDLSIGGLKLYQSVSGYRYSLDPILLASFVKPQSDDIVLDLGTGSGILPLLLARMYGVSCITGIELQSAMAERAQRNVALNGLSDRIMIILGDVRNINTYLQPESCKLVVSNPPFRPADGGRIAPNSERAMARHELAGGLPDFIGAAKFSLAQGGRFAIIYLAERLAELFSTLIMHGLQPKRLRTIHSYFGSSAKLVMVEARKGGKVGLEVSTPLYIYEGSSAARNYTREIRQIYGAVG